MMGRSAATISRELTRNRRDRGGTRELGRRSIHGRPEAVENREEFGHWEGDLMQFSTQRGNLITWCERKTRFAFAAPLKIKNGHQDWRGATGGSRNLAAEARKTISFDNGTEFALHQDLTAALGTAAFFCDPHSPWQRGTIKNTNVIFRRDMPRKTDLSNYSARDIADLAWAINSTPRKCLGFQTPAEAFLENINRCT